MDSTSSNKSAALALRRALAAVIGGVRRVLASLFQIVFKDRLRDISEKTDRLGAASVESVTYLGGDVRALNRRLEKIEQELAALRELLERRQGAPESEEDPARIPAPPSAS